MIENVQIEYEVEVKKIPVEKPVYKYIDEPVPFTINKIVEEANIVPRTIQKEDVPVHMKHIEVVERIEKETREYVTEKYEIVKKPVVKPITLTRDVPVFKPEYTTVMVDADGQEISKNGKGDPSKTFKAQFPVVEHDKS